MARRARLFMLPWLLVLAVKAGCAENAGISEKNRKLEQVQAQIRAVRDDLDDLDAKKRALVGQLSKIERDYGDLAQSLRDFEQAEQTQSLRLNELKQRKSQLREEVLRQHQALAGQARAAYSAGRSEGLKLLLNQEDPARASRMLTYYGYLSRARLSQLESLRQGLDDLRVLEGEVLAQAQQLDIARAAAEHERHKLEQSRQRRKSVLSKLELESKSKALRLRSLEEDAKRLQRLIIALAARVGEEQQLASVGNGGSGAFSAARGQLGWPVKGVLKAPYGAARLTGAWDGVLIGAREGEPVRAIAAGQVVFSDWLRGYGLLLIIDHGEDYMSVYAFTQSLYKQAGDAVEAGEIIASVGASGGHDAPGLYFGIRESGHPVNPMEWCLRGN
jgi:septal ring factor EnvC (AmiA/AmiB activator)